MGRISKENPKSEEKLEKQLSEGKPEFSVLPE